MKRIIAIEFTNYKAFFKSGIENRIQIPEGKSVLLYGENGSGKSSIYEGLKQFFSSSNNTIDTIPARHLRIPQSEIINPGEEDENEVLNEVSVKVTFSDEAGNEIRTFGVPYSDTQTSNYISQANQLNSFLSYRELLRTYLMDNPKNKEEFRSKFALLLVEVILAKQQNTVTQATFERSWENLFVPRIWYKEDHLENFTKGLKYEINRINLLLPFILKYFEEDFKVELVLTKSEIDKYHSSKMDRWGKYPIIEIDLNVSLFGETTDSEEENHLTVLNEARLSALAISIYFASLVNTPQDNLEFKILFLDDIFIGLDMGNRLPLLDILKNFKKPVIEQTLDADQLIVERIQSNDGIVQTEEQPFFNNYQIFISTYDSYWFNLAKNWFKSKCQDKWCFLELYANRRTGLTFDTPLLYTSLDYLEKANFYYLRHDHPSCANHLRKALEERLKILLPDNEHYTETIDAATGVREIKKLKTLNQYLEKFILYCDTNGVDASELIDLKNLKDWYFNPFSHDNIGTPIFKKEVELAKALVEKMLKFEFAILIPAASNLYFTFDNEAGQTREYKIELQENLRWINSEQGKLLTNPLIRCYEWTRNGEVEQVDWGTAKLFQFYNNKWRHLIGQNNIPDFEMNAYWNQLIQNSNNQPILSILED